MISNLSPDNGNRRSFDPSYLCLECSFLGGCEFRSRCPRTLVPPWSNISLTIANGNRSVRESNYPIPLPAELYKCLFSASSCIPGIVTKNCSAFIQEFRIRDWLKTVRSKSDCEGLFAKDFEQENSVNAKRLPCIVFGSESNRSIRTRDQVVLQLPKTFSGNSDLSSLSTTQVPRIW